MMKKPLIVFAGFLVLVLSGFLGCQKYPLPADLPMTPTPTPSGVVPIKPKPAATPIPGCHVSVSVTIPDHDGVVLDPLFVMRSVEDWNAYFSCSACTSTIPAPPVDFDNEMIAAFAQEYGDACTDAVAIRRVCITDTNIEIQYDFRDRYRAPDCDIVACAQVRIPLRVTRAIRLPASSLPVAWVQNNLCP